MKTRPVSKTRVLLVDMPQLLRDMMSHAIDSQADMGVVGEEPDPAAIAAAVELTRPEFVIVGLDHRELPAGCRDFLDARATPRLLGIEAQDGHAYLYELRPERIAVGSGSATPEGLIAVIRGVVAGVSA